MLRFVLRTCLFVQRVHLRKYCVFEHKKVKVKITYCALALKDRRVIKLQTAMCR